MIIKFYCTKHCADFEKSEEQLRTEHVITHCPYCGQKLLVSNLNEIVTADVNTQVKNFIDQWVKERGWDYVIDLVKRNRDRPIIGKLYVDELHRRGFNIK